MFDLPYIKLDTNYKQRIVIKETKKEVLVYRGIRIIKNNN